MLRRLLWANIAAVLLFGSLSVYHIFRYRLRPAVPLEQLLSPVHTSRGEAELRAKAEELARAAQASQAGARRLHMAMALMALAAAGVCLWNATSMSAVEELAEEIAALRGRDEEDEP